MMKKCIFYISLMTLFFQFSYGIVEENSYYDIGLKQKNGVFNFEPYLGQNYLIGFLSVGNADFFEGGFKLRTYLDFPELLGFYFVGEFSMSKITAQNFSGDLAWWGGIVPLFGETYFGFKKKYFNIKLGFQDLVSSDAIYNHLMIDDYSGSFFSLKIDSMISRFFDTQIVYSMIRPHQGPWYNGENEMTEAAWADDNTLYDALYGKSLYFHKMNFRPAPWIRIGIQESVFFLGENINPWYLNPFFIYFGMSAIGDIIKKQNGSRYNMHASDIKMGLDFNIGFHGWRLFGEVLIDDSNGEYFKFAVPTHPDKVAFLIGGELRGYLFTRYIKMPSKLDYFLRNLYINFEYSITSKYIFSRDSNFHYEYVREEYLDYYYSNNPPQTGEINKINRVGNFIGYMYGPDSDCIDVAIGWRNDLPSVKEDPAEYQADVYLDSLQNEEKPDRLIKVQLHYRHYRLGDSRNVILPYGTNEHPSYDIDWYTDTNGDGNLTNDTDGTNYRTSFMTGVFQHGNILDLNYYMDLIRISRFIMGIETKFYFHWYKQQYASHDLQFRWDLGLVISF